MKIAIDVSAVVYGTGVSVYTKQLIKNLFCIDEKNQYILFGGTLRRKSDILNTFPQAKIFPLPPRFADFVWNKMHIFPIEKLIGDIDVFHSSDWTQPPSKAFSVTTVHDLIPVKFPSIINSGIVKTHNEYKNGFIGIWN